MAFNFFGQFYGCLGIPNHSRAFAQALSSRIPELILCPISQDQGDHYGLTQNLESKFGKPNPNYSSLVFWYPDTYKSFLSTIPLSKPRIGYYIFEYTKIPSAYVDGLNSMDAICTASKWGVEILRNNGIKVPCHVVPGGVDSSIFNSSNRSLDSKKFRFLHIGKAENRKGTDIVIRAFNEAFKGDRKVKLSLYIDNPHLRKFNGDSFLHELKEHYSLKYPITNIEVRHFETDITHIYNTHHVAVFASKAEGIGLPIVEAMASGMPVIVPFNSGITEYANSNNSILITDLKNEEVRDPIFFPAGDYGTWNTPKDEDMIKSMLWAYENYPQAQDFGKQAEIDMRTMYTWENAAKRFIEIVPGE
jgi:glycosyltransferase involved in cell wall biosynthesis